VSTHKRNGRKLIYMMMIPRRHNDFDLIEDMFRDPFFTNEESKIMKTDIKEKKDKYIIDIDLPGYEKEDIKMSIEDGYLTVNASTNTEKEDKEEGKFVRKERYMGSCSRSFYVGDAVENEDIKASFKNGTLKIEIPKKENKKELPEVKYIPIDD
jgi:HSP20 family protein